MAELESELQRLARSPVLLIACDYDGTLAPIVDDPGEAKPIRESVIALRTLASMPQTHVAVISGRALRDLASLVGEPQDIHLVGSHGSEFDLDFATSLPPKARKLRERVAQELAELVETDHAFSLEEKPASIAFHFRNAPDDVAEQAVERIMHGPAAYDGVYTKHGKKVVELGVLATDKGRALDRLRQRTGATATVFLGDDETDEDAFATLRGPDVGVKVGGGETRARFRVDDPTEVARVLVKLCEHRAAWLSGAALGAASAIADHALLSDQRTAALLTPHGRVVWFCYPRIDSPAVFAELLGGPTAGHFSIRPIEEGRRGDPGGRGPIEQRYLGDSLTVCTRWAGVTVTDYLDCSADRPGQRAGRTDLVRVIERDRGDRTVRVRIEFAPRPDFGRMEARLCVREGGIEVEDTLEPIVLHAPGIEWTLHEEGAHQTAVAEVELGDEPVVLQLRCGTSRLKPAVIPEHDRRAQTEAHWSAWVGRLKMPGSSDGAVTAGPSVIGSACQRSAVSDGSPAEGGEPRVSGGHLSLDALIRRSALTLKALCYGPTGAILAAATTSLPEHIGGVRNWDYRYCWLRDGAMAAAALAKLGSTGEGMKFLDWVLGVLDECSSPERLHPVYSVTGGQLGPEAEIAALTGYRGSRPVRISNAASHQVQLDVFGPVVELIALLAERGAPLSSQHWRLVRAMVEAVDARWQDPDHGIWEVRSSRKHHVHSKVMCWQAVDRAIAVAEHTFDREPDGWVELRDRIANDVIEHGWSVDAQSFTAAYGEHDLDAAPLFVGLSGLLPADDERFIKTVEAVDRHLRAGPVVYRYRYDDGLPGIEGGFHICTSWLIESFVLIGRIDEARDLFGRMCRLVGTTHLLPEQYDPDAHESLGNHPQAFSHLGLINAALRFR